MHVAIRADASPTIGTGHIVRCRTLAEDLKARGVELTLICAKPTGTAMHLFAEAGFTVESNNVKAIDAGAPHDQVKDVQNTIKIVSDIKPDWLIVDHYGLDKQFEQKLRPFVKNILVVDDLFNRSHDCDVLVNPSVIYDRAASASYMKLVPQDCRIFIGPRYAPLRTRYRSVTKRSVTSVERVLVFFGGVDSLNLTTTSLRALSLGELADIYVDVVVGVDNPHFDEIMNLANERERTKVFSDLPHLAHVMSSADIAIGAGGATTWERMCCGLPSIVVSIADNQTEIAEQLSQQNLLVYAGLGEKIFVDQLAKLISDVVNDRVLRAELAERGRSTVDGYGALRLAEIVCPSHSSQLRIRPAKETDISVVFGWSNDPETRSQSLRSESVNWADHVAWYSSVLMDHKRFLFILEIGDLPVGQVRFDTVGHGQLKLSYGLDRIVRGRGWGQHLLELGIAQIAQKGDFQIMAEVKESNPASIRSLERIKFLCESQTESGIRRYIRLVERKVPDSQS